MKWLSGGLTFVNLAVCAALLLGLAAGGLGSGIALCAGLVGLGGAALAFWRTESGEASATNRCLGFWLLAGCFGFVAFRSFCWLIFSDGTELKVQSINNLGDLSLHLTYIRNFASGVALWPENPIHFASHLRYPAGTDLFNSLLLLLGLDLYHGLIWAGLLGSLATFYALHRWGGNFAIAGFLFNGGLAGLQFFHSWKLLDYQGDKSVAWKSLPLSMLVTQRGLLYALPAGLLLLASWRSRYAEEKKAPLPFWLELSLYASMPLFHIHTFMALSIVAACLFVFAERPLRLYFAKLVGLAFLPATFFVWTITDHFQASSLLTWKPGWVQNNGDFAMPFLKFWLFNFGLWPVFVFLLLGFCFWQAGKARRVTPSLAFLLPASLLFIFAWLVKTAPWEWDNIKIILWAYLIMLPFLWRELVARWSMPVQVAVCLALFSSGALSLLGGLVSNQSGFGVANRAELDAVGVVVATLPPEARFAAFPTYNHPLLLQGRKVVLGYPGHLWTQGFEYGPAMEQLNALMLGAPGWRDTAGKLRVRYLFWGREEKANYARSTRPWEHEATLVAEGDWGAIYDLGTR